MARNTTCDIVSTPAAPKGVPTIHQDGSGVEVEVEAEVEFGVATVFIVVIA